MWSVLQCVNTGPLCPYTIPALQLACECQRWSYIYTVVILCILVHASSCHAPAMAAFIVIYLVTNIQTPTPTCSHRHCKPVPAITALHTLKRPKQAATIASAALPYNSPARHKCSMFQAPIVHMMSVWLTIRHLADVHKAPGQLSVHCKL